MQKRLSIHNKWLVGCLIGLSLLVVSIFDPNTSMAHRSQPSYTPTVTTTPTLTPTPELQACQVIGIIFGREAYRVGDLIEVTIRVADQRGTPLVGAIVTAEVTRQPLNAQASTGFGLVDRAGEYDGQYGQTDQPGIYNFSIRVSDPTGERFLPCMGEAMILVEEIMTPTPTLTVTITPTTTETITPTPTDTPTVTPTPTTKPNEPIVEIQPETVQTTLCELQETQAINIEQAANVAAVRLEVTYDPQVIQVIDADAGRPGVQVRFDPIFAIGSVIENNVDTGNGRINFEASLLSPGTINGNNGLIAIDWRPQNVSTGNVTLVNVVLTDPNGQQIGATTENGQVEVGFVPNCSATGSVTLEGRTDFGNVIVTNSSGEQTLTEADGSFMLSADQTITFEHSGYLSAQVDLRDHAAITQLAGGDTVSLGTIGLRVGDINGDNNINILDLTYIAGKYSTSDPQADLNADGVVNILDLILAAGNFQRQGALAGGQ